MTLDTLTFDLDDTLWDNQPIMEHAELGHFTWLNEALSARFPELTTTQGSFADHFPLESYLARRQDIARLYPTRRSDFTWIRRHALFDSLIDYGLSSQDAHHWSDAAIERLLELRHQLRPFEGVESLLKTLAQRYRLGAITNGNADLKRLSLDAHFDIIVSAGEMHMPKPEPAPFLFALDRLGSTPDTAMHIGDSWKEDVLPAHQLGMQVAWIAPLGSTTDSLPARVHRLAHVNELPGLLARLAA